MKLFEVYHKDYNTFQGEHTAKKYYIAKNIMSIDFFKMKLSDIVKIKERKNDKIKNNLEALYKQFKTLKVYYNPEDYADECFVKNKMYEIVTKKIALENTIDFDGIELTLEYSDENNIGSYKRINKTDYFFKEL